MFEPLELKPVNDDAPEARVIPEQRLLTAIIQRAFQDLMGSDPLLAEQAAQWFFDSRGEPPFDPFSFPWICEYLDVDILRLQDALLVARSRRTEGSDEASESSAA